MGVLIGVGVLEIVIEALQKALEMNYLLAGSKILLWFWIIYTLYTFNFNVVLGTLAALIAFFSHLIGINFQNKSVIIGYSFGYANTKGCFLSSSGSI